MSRWLTFWTSHDFLSNESTQRLADAIAHDVFEVLSTDGRYLDGVMNSIESAITEVIGKTSPQLVGELGALIVEKIDGSNTDIANGYKELVDEYHSTIIDLSLSLEKIKLERSYNMGEPRDGSK